VLVLLVLLCGVSSAVAAWAVYWWLTARQLRLERDALREVVRVSREERERAGEAARHWEGKYSHLIECMRRSMDTSDED
jgi:hypothetical protein